jgi:hypothetical protein
MEGSSAAAMAASGLAEAAGSRARGRSPRTDATAPEVAEASLASGLPINKREHGTLESSQAKESPLVFHRTVGRGGGGGGV